MRDLNKIVKSINFRSQKNSKGKVSYKLALELVNGSKTEIFVNDDEFEAIKTLKELGIEPIKSRELVEEESENNEGKLYSCIKVVLYDDSVFRYFPSRAFDIVINAVYEKYCAGKQEKVNNKWGDK